MTTLRVFGLIIASVTSLSKSLPCDTNGTLNGGSTNSSVVDFSKESVCLISGATVLFKCVPRSPLKAIIKVLGRKSTGYNAATNVSVDILPEHDGKTGSCLEVNASNKIVHERKTSFNILYGPTVDGNLSRNFNVQQKKPMFLEIYVKSKPAITISDVDVTRAQNGMKNSNFYIKSASRSRQVIVVHFISMDRSNAGNYTVKIKSRLTPTIQVQIGLTIEVSQRTQEEITSSNDHIRTAMPYILGGLVVLMMAAIVKMNFYYRSQRKLECRGNIEISGPIAKTNELNHKEYGSRPTMRASDGYVDMKVVPPRKASEDGNLYEQQNKGAFAPQEDHLSFSVSKTPPPPIVHPRPKSTLHSSETQNSRNYESHNRRTVFEYPNLDGEYDVYGD